MDELRVVRREDGSLILANELGEEYRLAIDESIAQEVRLALPRAASAVRVRPREIQALLRAGKSRAEVAAETGLEEADVERFEEPVRAEKRYMLDLAHAVIVRTDPSGTNGSPSANEDEQRFGQVIAERLVGLGNVNSEWRSWRDEEAGWLVGLAFDSRDGDHDAVWSFDHKKRVLSPLTPDATNLSKVGEIGDRLIPKLRAVDADEPERAPKPEPAPFDPDSLLAPTQEVEPLPAADTPGNAAASDSATDEPVNADAEYERRREIDHLAVKTTDDDGHDLSQTADLLDALRRRRGERSREAAESLAEQDQGAAGDDSADPSPLEVLGLPPRAPSTRRGAAANIWGTAGVSGVSNDEDPAPANTTRESRSGDGQGTSGGDSADTAQLRAVPAAPVADPTPETGDGTEPGADSSESDATDAAPSQPQRGDRGQTGGREGRGSKRGRSSIPSWDDILFGTRSDDDPA